MRTEETPLRAIRSKCRDCTNGSLKDIRLCTFSDCPLYPFRMGRNPNRKGIGPCRILIASKTSLESTNFSKDEVINAEAETF